MPDHVTSAVMYVAHPENCGCWANADVMRCVGAFEPILVTAPWDTMAATSGPAPSTLEEQVLTGPKALMLVSCQLGVNNPQNASATPYAVWPPKIPLPPYTRVMICEREQTLEPQDFNQLLTCMRYTLSLTASLEYCTNPELISKIIGGQLAFQINNAHNTSLPDSILWASIPCRERILFDDSTSIAGSRALLRVGPWISEAILDLNEKLAGETAPKSHLTDLRSTQRARRSEQTA
ncbi:hypothetical protein TREMEDRAFT_64104 [Tremella mesenterica DSM 1558]|uniref:uncharacterized protein n=1 Tax=Tremella mesenterica (strain ATCC 24925 / CBS 8224 / DSM 1558 / NBRC 9311 / NRRL Y-6157 / RJB 2259-6 / UBC 559-6) TaxID=578456 RepID=UPI0003F493E8|nr:uncharacterized protein TREMEDRAFT_64104 [Tremella mesenterica DSM 1558]EIW67521.1 hypothetical protein TREMEDRAFT_64104 [Tremella mesenterica DSM 1558]